MVKLALLLEEMLKNVDENIPNLRTTKRLLQSHTTKQ